MLHDYFKKVTDLLKQVENQEEIVIRKAGKKIAQAIENEKIIHLFGCGHSHILMEEFFYRAGGLVPVRPIFHEPLMLHEGGQRSSQLEKQPNYAKQFMIDQPIEPGDVCIVLSTSGLNPVPIDVAQISKDKGAFVIGLTSIPYSTSQSPRHQSGKRLMDVVDLVINNKAPIGDAILMHEEVTVPFSSSSTLIGVAILHAVFAEAIKMMGDKGIEAPVFVSGNIEGSATHNQKLVEKYQNRINF
ncbi:hypothetical protein BN1058_00619 [Paraliobacillus sp. PM-2]|uniref:SIS domain-containing protein n=1 Tax=Paraliobacillus sp. PM-2 TaxID=1462524 RepID=UPI00061C89AF|nr:SIS domain-containing protein [Paraliobacillus sp. PM-2]CQR46362.1 hypothetical protein BN1058_00619 [Paraliobacillus sp. PM-2]